MPMLKVYKNLVCLSKDSAFGKKFFTPPYQETVELKISSNAVNFGTNFFIVDEVKTGVFKLVTSYGRPSYVLTGIKEEQRQ
jgi:hypothetical protein